MKNKMDKSEYGSAILDIMPDGLIIVDPKGNILDLNPAALQMLGYEQGELNGESCQVLNCSGCKIFNEEHDGDWCSLYKEGRIQAKECLVETKQKKTISVLKNASVLKDREGNVIGALEIMTDISKQIKQQDEIKGLRRQFSLDSSYHGLIGKSKEMQKLFELIENVAQTTAPVMINGKSGTGKELVARAIHEAGARAGKPFVKVNCAALNDNLLESELFGHVKGAFTGADQTRIGRFEAANEGTLFLDEIGDISLSTQVKLLRVLEEKEIERVGDNRSIPVDVRIITATNKNLEALVDQGVFREDFYFRINVFPIHCPAVSERKEDIPIILQNYIDQHIKSGQRSIKGLTSDALKLMCEYSWPGNVREIRNAIEYAFVLCQGERIDVEHLPAKIKDGDSYRPEDSQLETSEQTPRSILVKTLRQVQGNQSKAAEILGVSRVTVWKRMKKYDIKKGDYMHTI